MTLRRRVSLLFANQVVLSILAMIIIAHVVAMFLYLRESNLNSQAIRRNAVIQKIINAIYTVEATPVATRSKAVSAMEDPDINVTLTRMPNPKALRFQQVSYWNISKALRGKLSTFNLSIEMGPMQWLNIKATIYHHVLYTQLFLFFVEIFIFGTIFISAWSIRRFTHPLKKFKQAAEQLGIDLHSRPVSIYGPPVVREAAAAMNQMQHRIQDLIHDRTQMLAAISHDLRTPITRMKLRSQFVDDQQLQSKFIVDLDEMSNMIDEVLAFATEDANNEGKKRFDLISLLTTAVDQYVSTGANITITTDLYRVPIAGRPIAIKRAFNNIINNALSFAHSVKVTISEKAGQIVIQVDDDGPGISQADIKDAFKPFYRGEKSRNRNTGGVGLGLAVAYDIVRTHGGKINLENLDPHGLRVRITVPYSKKNISALGVQ